MPVNIVYSTGEDERTLSFRKKWSFFKQVTYFLLNPNPTELSPSIGFFCVIESNVSSALKHFSLNWIWSQSTVCTKPVNMGMHFHLQTSTCCAYLATKERVQGPDQSEKPWSSHFAFAQGLELAQRKRMLWKGTGGRWRVGLWHPQFRAPKWPWCCNPSHEKKFLRSGSLPI